MSTRQNAIAEFMGGEYKHDFAPDYITFDPITFLGMTGRYSCKLEDCRFRTSWDWQVPVWAKLALEVKTWLSQLDSEGLEIPYYLRCVERYEESIFQNDTQKGYEVIVSLLKWYNDLKHRRTTHKSKQSIQNCQFPSCDCEIVSSDEGTSYPICTKLPPLSEPRKEELPFGSRPPYENYTSPNCDCDGECKGKTEEGKIWAVIPEGRTIQHIVPINDPSEHEESTTCQCQPTVKFFPEGMIVIHNSSDKIEPQ
jgi:hypothetical protein